MHHCWPELDTPALVVDLNVLEQNLKRMARNAADHGVKLRPHIKTHKSPWITHRQLAAGAVGVTVAKIGEAEVMVQAGITDILLAYPVVGELKLRRLERLLCQAEVILSVDSVEVAEGVAGAALRVGQKARLYVDVDTGLQRVGLPAGEPSVRLVEEIAALPDVEVVGVMSHAGHVSKGRTQREVEALATQAAEALVSTAETLRQKGIPIQEVSPGSTVGASFELEVEGVTEIRPGTYAFNDANAVRRWAADEDDCALTVLATVVSKPAPDRIVIDAGSKTLSSDAAVGGASLYGIVVGHPDMRITRLSEEHGVVELGPESDVRVGDRLAIVPNHVCPVVNLHDRLYGVEDGQVKLEIVVAGRGKNQ